jgi:hypothetical protein
MCGFDRSFTTCGIWCRGFLARQTTLKVASNKIAKHEKTCSHNQHVFIPFAFDTSGFLASDVVDLLHRVQRVVHKNVMFPKSMNVVFTIIGFAMKKDLVAQLITHLSSIYV